MPIRKRTGPVKQFWFSTLLLAVVAVWGWTFVVVKDAVETYGVASFLAVRFAVAAAAFAPFAARRVTRGSLRVGMKIGVVLAAAYAFQTFGLKHSTAAVTGLITGLCIVFAPIANRLLFGVRTGPVHWAAVGASLIGLALLTITGPVGISWGDMLTLGCAACFGLHIALLDRHASEHDAGALAFVQVATGAVLFLAVCPAFGPIIRPDGKVWFALLLTGVVATAIGFYVQTYVQQRLSAIRTAAIIVCEPIFAVGFGYALAEDRLTGLQIAGAVLMVFAVGVAEFYSALRTAAANGGFFNGDSAS